MSTETAEQRSLDDELPQEPMEIEDIRIGVHLLPVYPGEPEAKFVANIRQWGVLNPLQVVNTERGYEVIDGRRRLSAARAIGLTDVPARLIPMNGFVNQVLTLGMNSMRSSNPAAELAAIETLIGAGFGESAIAKATGMSVGTIRKRMRLVGLTVDLRTAFEDGRISPSVAEAAAKLTRSQQAVLEGKLEGDEPEGVRMKDVSDLKRARKEAATAQVPAAFFDVPPVPAVSWDQFQEAAIEVIDAWDGKKPLPVATLRRLKDLLEASRGKVSA